MYIGVPRETHRHEHRVGLNPYGVRQLTHAGHTVVVESRAGEGAHFSDHDYEAAGARIVFSPEEAYQRADLVCRVGTLAPEEIDLLKPGSALCSFQHLAVMPKANVERLMGLEMTLIGYELIRDHLGDRPVLHPFSEMGGQMAVQLATYYLQNSAGGRGILLGEVPGVPPPTVLILGAGRAGRAAARRATAAGAHAIVTDVDIHQLRELHDTTQRRIPTVLQGPARLRQYTSIADVLIGAVLVPGARSPFVVTEEMVKAMKPGSVIVDLSIDQGGCVETCRPTTLSEPTFIKHGIVHYCVPNLTANVARTASRALANSALPYLVALADLGVAGAVESDPGLAEGLYLFRGKMVNRPAGDAVGVPVTPLEEMIEEGTAS
jgi:alanine dehydrogenase